MKATFIIGCIVGVYFAINYPTETSKAWDAGKNYILSINDFLRK